MCIYLVKKGYKLLCTPQPIQPGTPAYVLVPCIKNLPEPPFPSSDIYNL